MTHTHDHHGLGKGEQPKQDVPVLLILQSNLTRFVQHARQCLVASWVFFLSVLVVYHPPIHRNRSYFFFPNIGSPTFAPVSRTFAAF